MKRKKYSINIEIPKREYEIIEFLAEKQNKSIGELISGNTIRDTVRSDLIIETNAMLKKIYEKLIEHKVLPNENLKP